MEVVIARHCQPSDWLEQWNVPVTIYHLRDCSQTDRRGSRPDTFSRLSTESLIGSSFAAAYLKFIVDRYQTLPEYAVFSQGDNEFRGVELRSSVELFFESPVSKDFPIVYPVVRYNSDGPILQRDADKGEELGAQDDNTVVVEYNSEAPFAVGGQALYQALFGGTICTAPPLVFAEGSRFIVPRSVLLARPLSFWRQLLEAARRCPSLAEYLERVWLFIFDPRHKLAGEAFDMPCLGRGSREQLPRSCPSGGRPTPEQLLPELPVSPTPVPYAAQMPLEDPWYMGP